MTKTPAVGTGTVEWLGVVYKTILSSEESEGRMSIMDIHSPVGSGPPRHIHHKEDEVFVLLSGEYEFWLEGETFSKGPCSCRAARNTRIA